MSRSGLLAGRIQQRDRAQLRGRLDARRSRRSAEVDAHAQLTSWLAANVIADELAPLEALDLTAFLRDTAGVDLPPEERLRYLAIFIEDRVTWRDEQPRAWLAHDRIYGAALRLNARDPWLHSSRAISAREHAEGLFRFGAGRQAWIESPVRRRMMQVAHAAAGQAAVLAPDDAGVLVSAGDVCYHDPDHGPAEALPWYERALERAPDDGWAALYRAHCLQDLERWREAAAAYDAVNPALFVGPRAWRLEHLLEQRAYCRLRGGELDRARLELEGLLERWEQDPHLAGDAWGWHLAEAARGPLRDALFERARRLFEREQRAEADSPRGRGLDSSMLDR